MYSDVSMKKQFDALRKEAELEAKRTRKGNQRRLFIVDTFRVIDVQALIQHRYNGGPCDTDDGEWLDAVLPSLQRIAMSRGNNPAAFAREWANRWVPCVAQGRGEGWFATTLQERRLQWPSPDKFAKMLRITQAEVEGLKLATKVSITRPKAVRDAERKAKAATREKERRRASGARLRSASIERSKPWKAQGISRATYYRQKRNLMAFGGIGSHVETGSCASLSTPVKGDAHEPVSSLPDISRYKGPTSWSGLPMLA